MHVLVGCFDIAVTTWVGTENVEYFTSGKKIIRT
jgi:hypothetical protein